MTIQERSTIQTVQAYQPVDRPGLNLSDNANLFEPNPVILDALTSIDPETVRGYPSGYADALREAIAGHHDLTPEHVVTANGSSDLIDLIVRTFTDPGDAVAHHPPSFSMIPLWTRCNAATPHPVPLQDGFQLDVDAFSTAPARLGFVCRPNNPTGNAFPLEHVQEIAERFDGLLVVDEAYVRFTDHPDATPLIDRGDVIVLRSISKDAGLAGARFGYGLMAPELAQAVHKVRGPFRVPCLTEALAQAAVENPQHAEEVARIVKTERARVTERLDALGLSPFPSETNFVLLETPWPGARFASALADEGVLVREFTDDALEACVRATVGPPDVNDRFLEAVEAVLEGGGP